MVFVASTMAFVSATLAWEAMAMVSQPDARLLLTRRMISLVKNIFWFAKLMVSAIENMVCAMHPIVARAKTMVTSASKTVSVAPTMVCVNQAELRHSEAGFFLEPHPARIMIVRRRLNKADGFSTMQNESGGQAA